MKKKLGRPAGKNQAGSLADLIDRCKVGKSVWTEQDQRQVWRSTKNGVSTKTASFWAINIINGETIKITRIKKIKDSK